MIQVILLFFLHTASWALGVYHHQRPFTSFENLSGASFCAIDTYQAPQSCSSSLYKKKNREDVYFHLNMKADGDAIENGRKLVFEEITENTIRTILKKNNFNSATFDSRIEFNTKYFSIYYSPYFITADVLVQNPAVPEISLFLANKSELGMLSSYNINDYISLGSRIGYQTIKYARSEFTLLDLGTTSVGNLIDFQTKYTPSIDASISLWGDALNAWIPSLTFQAKNIGSTFVLEKTNFNSTSGLEPFTLFETYYQTTIGKLFQTQIGLFKLGTNIFYDKKMAIYNEYTSIGAGYDLGRFSFNIDASKYKQSIGYIFKSSMLDIGLVYIKEKELGNIQRKHSDSVYLSGSFHL